MCGRFNKNNVVALKHPQIVCEIRKEANFDEVPAFIFYR